MSQSAAAVSRNPVVGIAKQQFVDAKIPVSPKFD